MDNIIVEFFWFTALFWLPHNLRSQNTLCNRLPLPNSSTSYGMQVWAVWKINNTIHQKNHYPVDNVVCIVNTYPSWIAIYPVDSYIQPSNNWDLICRRSFALTKMSGTAKIAFKNWKMNYTGRNTNIEQSKHWTIQSKILSYRCFMKSVCICGWLAEFSWPLPR